MTVAYRLSVGQVLKRDWASAGLVFLSAFMWVVAAVTLILPAGPDVDGGMLRRIFVALAVVVTGGCAVAAYWRIGTIRRVFAAGAIVEGRVTELGANAEHVPTATVAYSYGGRDYRVANVTGLAGGRLAAGDVVQVAVDPDQPSRAYLVALYAR